MNLKNKNILILGLGISGVSTVKALNKLGAKIIISDLKEEEELQENISQIENLNIDFYLGTNDVPLNHIDLIVKSPGIPPNLDIIKKAKAKGIEVLTDLELAYRISPNSNFIAITGTNGKTTTTTLVGQFFNKAGFTTHVAGNIGVGILWDVVNSSKEDVFVVEASSFQLENTVEFNPKISLILNITPDHLNWHNTLDNYIKAKKKIFLNQAEDEYTILNYDDPLLKGMKDEIKANLTWFSVDNKLSKGIYIENGYVVIDDGDKAEKVIRTNEIKILGKHNLENVLASVAIGWIMGLDINVMKKVLRTFPGVEHRIEYVDIIDGIKFYNDSKGTNPEASIKAIEAVESPIILIAGGHDKGSEFDNFILSFKGKVKSIVLLGETKEKIKDTALKYGFNNVYIVDNMEEAVIKSYGLAESGDNILLSPACASWDMYNSFEMRGNDFKKAVYDLKEE
ncbi:UDP-N-acetylmuramoylalanine--D-glutamate ligase [[Clostridium] ultunense Esp]|uniref:UDP-N-acetylmuramoylalanine--D-glutamate ligase n=1 Tax=[Clostridium] ultunense Esp TaxID=1288971 RepID=M1ZCJ0_9FIRM|nr:UDP-N-acetylmuramoyl-L-alanine--D-glutamate ligase [Schnuerera ultunensis]CCQ95849.1 UDP-N-acetylmuramoylalanine--D-glutamate ligase [[Clostridium] ultunense Esp]SHD77288.1 UDP-N-acetylmuramoylalanine--D-glutamate ligase [[Clostridium] ultunense Esp]